MASDVNSGPFQLLRRNGDVALSVGVFGMLAILMVPLPPLILDLLLATSITLSLLIFLVSLYVRKPVDFSAFPVVLLIATLFRLSLTVASTRLILLNGAEGTDAAGHVIEAFGNFVVGGNYVVGFILFCLLLVINFIVITKGAGRVAEVAARFTLDAMPGKQLAIDAELNAGLIDETEARTRREEISRESDFYGAMDGASKFIKGDAIAAILIMAINIFAGVVIGLMNGLDIVTALQIYTVLTIGDGLASQIPAIIVSAAAGLLGTRGADPSNQSLDAQFGSQLLGNPRALGVLAALAGSFILVPGLRLPFAVVCVVIGGVAWAAGGVSEAVADVGAEPEVSAEAKGEARLQELLRVEPLVLEVSLDLVYLFDEKRDGTLPGRVQRIRRQVAKELGVLVPPVHVRESLRLTAGDYQVLLRGEIVGSGEVVARQLLALEPGGVRAPKLPGTPGVDPVFGIKGFWVVEGQRLRAQSKGYTVVDVATVIATHLEDLIRGHAHEIYGRRQLQDMLQRVGSQNPRLVEELIPDPLPRSTVLRVIRNLISEGVGIRDGQVVLEALSELAPRSRDASVLTELVRQRMARIITRRFVSKDGTLHYLGLAADAEDAVVRGLQGGDGGSMSLVLDPEVSREILMSVRKLAEGWGGQADLVLLTPPLARGPIRRLLERSVPRLPVVSAGEIVPGTALQREGEIGLGKGLKKSGR